VSGSPPQVVAYVAAGSNIEPRRNLPAALEALRGREEVSGVSTAYRSRAVGPDGQVQPDAPDFLNAVFEVRAARGPVELKHEVLRPIEAGLGRTRGPDKFAPRTIDLDLVLYGEATMDTAGLRLPAPDLLSPFILVPLLELAPALVLPNSRQPLCCLWPGGIPAGMAPDGECTRVLKEILNR